MKTFLSGSRLFEGHARRALLLLLALLFGPFSGWGQLRFQQNFDGTGIVPNIGYSGAITLSTGLTVTHNGSPGDAKYYALTPNPANRIAWTLSNGGTGEATQTILFNNIRFAPGSTGNRVEFLLAALTNNPQNGNELGETVQVSISTNEGLTFFPVATVRGNHAAHDNSPTGFKNGVVWSYMGNDFAPGSLTAAAAFNGQAPAAAATVFTPGLLQSINSNNRDVTGAGGFGRVSIAISNALSVRVKITMTNHLNQQVWGFDNFQVFSSDPIALPVELTRFGAVVRPEGVALSWATATEHDNDRFEVQRSADGRSFETIATVAGQGTSVVPQRYAALDARPLPGRAYYRLRQVDFDGTASFSAVAAVRWPGTGENLRLSLHPNPSAGSTLTLGGEGAAGPYRILNRLGQAVRQGQTAGTIEVRTLPAGPYLLELSTPAGRRTQRFARE